MKVMKSYALALLILVGSVLTITPNRERVTYAMAEESKRMDAELDLYASRMETYRQELLGKRIDSLKKINPKYAYLIDLYVEGKELCDEADIPVGLMISQALLEQGWRKPKNNRIFNISAFGSQSGEVVVDNGRLRKYRTYANLSDAIQDYCDLLSTHRAYENFRNHNSKDSLIGIELIGKSGYAEDPHYGKNLKTIYHKHVEKLVEKLDSFYA